MAASLVALAPDVDLERLESGAFQDQPGFSQLFVETFHWETCERPKPSDLGGDGLGLKRP
jgi:hypothetical protein